MTQHYWITSIGRTGTQWLAECMGWPHEPKDFPARMVSPAHLHRLAFGHIYLPPTIKVAIVVRNAHDQMRSILERLHALRRPIEQQVIANRHSIYRQTLEMLINRYDAGIIRYEEMTRSLEDLDVCLTRVNFPSAARFVPRRLNTHPKLSEFDTLPAWAVRTAQWNQEHYDRWLSARGMRSSTAEGSSGTTTSSPPRSQP